ncbi:MAG: hypothetical protein RBR20_03965 [Desulfobacterales bacterium]|jgi:hypothetical protein|nr:hypothetical protein [Desulfobacteraceae bacterium]MDD3991371.1 hypothetical protein [Desulfobacteraceae bacterium]MDY0311260.1 hypothetical protein [Desulfobacterales bacterium]
MNDKDCIQEKRSSRILGFLAIPFFLFLNIPLMLLFPVLGVGFALAGLAIAAIFVLAPSSAACRLIAEPSP